MTPIELLRAAVPPNVYTVCNQLVLAGHEAVTVGGPVTSEDDIKRW